MMEGGCYCGEVSFAVEGAVKRVINCHCGLCRRLSGAAFTTWVSVPRERFHLQTRASSVSSFAPTANGVRHFCGRCGTHVYSIDHRDPGVVGIPAGVLADADVAPPQAHYFVTDAAPWHVIADHKPRFGGATGFEPLDDETASHDVAHIDKQ